MLARLGRPLLSRPWSALYSSQSAMRETEELIRSTPSSPSSQSVRRAAPGTWKPFSDNGVVLPHYLSYKYRRGVPHPPRRRSQVGPPPAQARYNDVFHQFGIDPLSMALNPALLSRYVSEIGKIYGRPITHLTMKSQRRIGKAIRRAKMMGIIPVHSLPRFHRF
ncbi:hypothetical protein AX14_002843 [Amanita brunnescens Koide BX004]|nr:hypothetical protein AX14_002843 [Amanita brunnescens Koide BX004]